MTSTPTSRELLDRAREGDRDALDRLCERYLPRLRRWAHGRLPRGARDLVDTDDLVQTTLAESVGHLKSFEPRGEGAFQAYLRQAMWNRIRDHARRVGRRGIAAELPPDVTDPKAPSPLDEAVGQETLARYEAALSSLREDERAAIVARVEMDCSYAEIAEMLGRPTSDAARMAVARALVRLAKGMSHGG